MVYDSSVFVCTDIVNHVISCSRYWLVGHRFSTIEDAFTEPFQSSKFNIYVASKLSDITYECDEKMISAKMYAFTMNLNCGLNIRSAKQKWFISALHHTMKKWITRVDCPQLIIVYLWVLNGGETCFKNRSLLWEKFIGFQGSLLHSNNKRLSLGFKWG